jgi:hypothetical protein
MITREQVLALLSERDYTITEMSEALNTHRKSAWRQITRAHADGQAHILDWRRAAGNRGGTMTAIYRIGPGEDAKKPRPYTPAERTARHMQKNRMIFKARRAAKNGQMNPFFQLLEAAR